MFNTLYAKGSLMEDTNERVINEITEAEKDCSPFLIECGEINGWWGIWLKVENERLLIDPYELTSSIYKDDRYYLFDNPKDEVKANEYPGHFYVDVRRENHIFEWRIGHTEMPDTGRNFYTFEEYLSKIVKALTELHNVWKEGEQIAYNPYDVKLDAVEMCLKQLEIKHTLPSHYKLMTKDVKEEEFQFTNLAASTEEYLIGIGNRSFCTFLTHWDNDYERIRHQMECLAFGDEATICLTFDTSDTVLKLRKTSVLDRMEKVGEGVSFKYKDYMIVEIKPNEFVHKSILKGYCDVEKTARTFYEGLLRLALCHPLRYDSDDYNTPSRLVAYNKFKSPIFESYLRKEYTNDNEYAIRQVQVKHIMLIAPGFVPFLRNEEFAGCGVSDLYDKEGKSIEMPELEKWAAEMNPIIDASEAGMPYEMDWEDFHRRGLELAKHLRDRLSTDFDLWYGTSDLDESGTIPKPMLII